MLNLIDFLVLISVFVTVRVLCAQTQALIVRNFQCSRVSLRYFFEVHCFHQVHECLCVHVFPSNVCFVRGPCPFVDLDVSSTHCPDVRFYGARRLQFFCSQLSLPQSTLFVPRFVPCIAYQFQRMLRQSVPISLRMIRSCGLGLVPSHCRSRQVHALRRFHAPTVGITACKPVCHKREHWDVCCNKCQPHRWRSECSCFGAQQRCITVVSFLVSRRPDCSRHRTQTTRFPQQGDLFSAAKIHQFVQDRHMLVSACSHPESP